MKPYGLLSTFLCSLICMLLTSCVEHDGLGDDTLAIVGQSSAASPTNLDVGDVVVFEGNRSFDLPTPTGSENYVLITTGDRSEPTSLDQPYVVAPARVPRPTKDDFEEPGDVANGSMLPDGAGVPLTLRFDSHLRNETARLGSSNGDGNSPRIVDTSASAEPQSTASFLVLQCTDCSFIDPGSFTTVTADLRYEGVHVLIYSDVNQPTGSFTQADYEMFGGQFDSQIHPSNTLAFGTESDIDSNGKVILLFSPKINDLTPDGGASMGFIAGFFLVYDLVPGMVPAGTSNGAEILYMMVPDPNGEYGNVFPKYSLLDILPVTIAHEFEHQISSGYRLLTYGTGAFQAVWLEEGMAHMAEDLNGFDSQNILRANLYLSDPGNTSLVGWDSIQMRGGIFLFLRYLGDRFGEAIYRDIVQSSCVGEPCLENATGLSFSEILADFLATLYLSNRGITASSRYNFTSFDLQSDFGPLFVTGHDLNDGAFGGSVRNCTGDYHQLGGFWSAKTWLRVKSPLNVRTVIVRTQ